ncbi:MAG: hypothetical protein LBT82_03890 [Oscillospiraceae bacterium]|jgi:hypothetical protein|nr:hypothetical protein [Oscillospiraceae bacterium]
MEFIFSNLLSLQKQSPKNFNFKKTNTRTKKFFCSNFYYINKLTILKLQYFKHKYTKFFIKESKFLKHKFKNSLININLYRGPPSVENYIKK